MKNKNTFRQGQFFIIIVKLMCTNKQTKNNKLKKIKFHWKNGSCEETLPLAPNKCFSYIQSTSKNIQATEPVQEYVFQMKWTKMKKMLIIPKRTKK